MHTAFSSCRIDKGDFAKIADNKIQKKQLLTVSNFYQQSLANHMFFLLICNLAISIKYYTIAQVILAF